MTQNNSTKLWNSHEKNTINNFRTNRLRQSHFDLILVYTIFISHNLTLINVWIFNDIN